MSRTPETPEAGGASLRHAIQQLPLHEPDPATWARVAAQLAADEALARLVPALPAHEPDDDLWAAIAGRLDAGAQTALPPPAPPVVRALWPARAQRWALALAASVLLVLLGAGAWWQLRPVPSVAVASAPSALRETVSFSEEVSAGPAALVSGADPLQQQGVAFIDAHCSSELAVCGSTEFRALRTQLAELESQQTQLRQDARRFGESPTLLREQARLITLQATVTRALVQLLIS